MASYNEELDYYVLTADEYNTWVSSSDWKSEYLDFLDFQDDLGNYYFSALSAWALDNFGFDAGGGDIILNPSQEGGPM